LKFAQRYNFSGISSELPIIFFHIPTIVAVAVGCRTTLKDFMFNSKTCAKIHLFPQFLSPFPNPAEIADFEDDSDEFKKVINISKKSGKKW